MIKARRLRRTDDSADVNVTPLLDIVFILLIFFIVTTSFVKEFGVDMSRPSNAPMQEQKREAAIIVRIDETGRVYVDERLVALDAVRANIETGLARKPGAPVVVVADRATDAGHTVRVVDQARVAGAGRVALASNDRR
ncbi:MAG: biopolymer transporter ExbD [Gammaproteobacteria bacterium]|nr:biopolymer transporter ExbD [Gammaproteobacteria bacterium]MCY4323415.1 biopolymer transporter ExbD [Gammaproteobacteria bacterium]